MAKVRIEFEEYADYIQLGTLKIWEDDKPVPEPIWKCYKGGCGLKIE